MNLKGTAVMSVWDWTHEFRRRAKRDRDAERVRLTAFFDRAWQVSEADPDQALAILAEGRSLAESLGEPRWALFFDHWQLQVLRCDKLDFRGLLDRAVKAALEARKPAFADLPQRICLQEDLVSAYASVDPRGYEDLIEQALQYMEKEVTPDLECRHCVQNCRTQFELDRGRPEAARASAAKALALAEDASDHYRANALSYQCLVAFRDGDYAALDEWACAGEEEARACGNRSLLAEFLLSQALAARHRGDEETARRHYRSAAGRMARLGSPPGSDYFDTLCAFHELAGDDLKALRARDQELETLARMGRLHDECQAHLKRCRLLARLGRLRAADLEAARAAARRLRMPGRHLAEINRLAAARGDGTGEGDSQ